MWQLGPDLVQPVSEMLAREYGVQQENLGQQIADICGRLVDSYWDNNSGDILDIVDGSLLMGYDEAGQEFQFKSAAAISITYAAVSYTHLDVYKRQARRRADLPFGVSASRVQKACFSPMAVQHGGQCNPGGLCNSETVN